MERARKTREAVLAAARRELLARGYAAATIAQIARRARVSVETIYKTFGGKPGLVEALYQRSLEGRGPRPAEERSDAMSGAASDPRDVIRAWCAFMPEVAPLVAPIQLLIRAAADGDRSMAALREATQAQRLARMRHNAQRLADRGWLRQGLSVERAADIMWTFTSPEFYELMVIRRGWSPAELGDFAARSMIGALL